uniref:aromatic ring-hydroxylating dioxygenase subunit alpha n=1 Tax=Roseovarius sp. TaxID=1486281 RepID=UPI003563DBC8
TITLGRDAGVCCVKDASGTDLPTVERFGHLWTSPGLPNRDLFTIPEADSPGRRLVDVGSVRVKCSPLRAVENFLDIAHFPFVHTDILGAEPHTEVDRYDVTIREDVDEVWATKVKFFQPKAAKSAAGGITTEYMYRVPAPSCAVLYKTCPTRPGEWDIITLFVQPLTDEWCEVWPWMALYDDDSTMAEMVSFQQLIFMQDRSILENQVPRKLPLDPGMEAPTQADMTSIAYRRWLKKIGYTYGAQLVAA